MEDYNPNSPNPINPINPTPVTADPLNPIPPTLAPGDPAFYDRYGNARVEPGARGTKGPYILLGLLVVVGIVGGLVYFNHGSHIRPEQAMAPMTGPATPARGPAALPLPATPATPNNPGGMTGPAAGGAANPTPAPAGTHQ